MIKYNLKCKKCKKEFESWFASSKEYEKLVNINKLNCIFCNSYKVEKSLMSPNIQSSKNKNDRMLNNKKMRNIRNKIKDYQKFIKENFDYVGDDFSYKARTLHYKKTKNFRGIYGNASKKEILELKEEGIETDIIPWFDDKKS
tara:strand:- start:47 stop:475 length:429 start_codon:yes stop_codon:yes gene_type:complete